MPRVGSVHLDVVEVGAVATFSSALAHAVVEDLNASSGHVNAHVGDHVERELLLRVAAMIAVCRGAVTDVQTSGAAVEPDSWDALTVSAAVAADSEVDDVGPAAGRSGRVQVKSD